MALKPYKNRRIPKKKRDYFCNFAMQKRDYFQDSLIF